MENTNFSIPATLPSTLGDFDMGVWQASSGNIHSTPGPERSRQETKEGPSPSEWEKMKDHILEIYIVEGRTLDFLVKWMKTEFGFEASKKMYNTRFKKWGPLFDKNKKRYPGGEDVDRLIPRRPRTRQKRAQQQGADGPIGWQYGHDYQLLTILTQTPGRYKAQEVTLYYINNYTCGLFVSYGWTSDMFKMKPPVEHRDHAYTWQDLADEFYGATMLIVKGYRTQGFEDLDKVCGKLCEAIRFNDPAMMVKLWRICLRLHKLCRILSDPKLQSLYSFLQYLSGLARIFHPQGHPLPRLLRTLGDLPCEDVLDTLRIAYLKAIRSMESILGGEQVIVLHMRSNYLKSWADEDLSTRNSLSLYQDRLDEAERIYGFHAETTVEVLHWYLYAAYYNANDHSLAMELASTLLERAKALPCLSEAPKWSIPTQGYALAMKLLATFAFETDQIYQSCLYMKDAIFLLGKGDLQCKRRAFMLREILKDWLVEWGELEEVNNVNLLTSNLDIQPG